MAFTLPVLAYPADSLAPNLGAETFEYHHGKHHLTYVNNLNGLLPGSGFENADLVTIVKKSSGPIFNNAAQVWNHTFYFDSFSPSGKRTPSGPLSDAIIEAFGSFDGFKEQFTKAAVTLFGSGWAWLSVGDNGKLVITQESNAGNPMTKGLKPVLTCDVWEHAYYIDYRNRRPDYLKAFWEVIDWSVIEKRY
ncbi:MAG: superoxide dismutase [Bacteroidales bacterium]